MRIFDNGISQSFHFFPSKFPLDENALVSGSFINTLTADVIGSLAVLNSLMLPSSEVMVLRWFLSVEL